MVSEKEKMIAGLDYQANDPLLEAERKTAGRLLADYNQNFYNDEKRSPALLKTFLGFMGERCVLTPPFFCDYGYNLFLGDDVYFNYNCVVLDVCPVKIGHHVLIGPGVHIYAATHPLNANNRKKVESGRPVIIADNVWIGGQAVILPGVTIGQGAVVGAGSVVTGNVPPMTLVAGNPAKFIRNVT